MSRRTCRRRYRAPARYDDDLIVKTRVTGARGPVIKFGYEIVRAVERYQIESGGIVGLDNLVLMEGARHLVDCRLVLDVVADNCAVFLESAGVSRD